MNVLVNLHRGYGIGDACQVSVVLQHLKKYHPDWCIYYRAEEGKHQVGRSLVHQTLGYQDPLPNEMYDQEYTICLYDKWWNFHEKPNTHVVACLEHTFQLGWDRECGKYHVELSEGVIRSAKYAVDQLWTGSPGCMYPVGPAVAIHYQGDSARDYKDLTHEQASQVCDVVYQARHIPLLIDWRDESPLANEPGISTTGRLHFSSWWGHSVEMNCATVAACRAFVGIDSGPGKCASAIDTPSLIVWTRNHLARFHDPAPNTTHLVPHDWRDQWPVRGDPGVVSFVEDNYRILTYEGEQEMMGEINWWLKENLK